MWVGETTAVYICECLVYMWCERVSAYRVLHFSFTFSPPFWFYFNKLSNPTRILSKCVHSSSGISAPRLLTPPSMGWVKQIKRYKPSTPKHAKKISFISSWTWKMVQKCVQATITGVCLNTHVWWGELAAPLILLSRQRSTIYFSCDLCCCCYPIVVFALVLKLSVSPLTAQKLQALIFT